MAAPLEQLEQRAVPSAPLVRSKAPLRISFCGGGTDVMPYAAEHGGVVLSTTINWHAFATLLHTDNAGITVESLDYGVSARYDRPEDLVFDGKLDLVKSVIRRLGGDRSGIKLYLHSDAPPGSGLGSSSALVVAMVGLFQHDRRLRMDAYAIARLAYQLERVDLGIVGGMQDQYAAEGGGFNFIEFSADTVVVNRLRVNPDILNELEYSLLLCYTGQTRVSGHIVDRQISSYVSGRVDTTEALHDFGSLLHEAWEHKKRLDGGISTPQIDELYATARNQGALGGKILGAGGGGYLLVFCPFDRRHIIARELERAGGRIYNFSFAPEGVQTWEAR